MRRVLSCEYDLQKHGRSEAHVSTCTRQLSQYRCGARLSANHHQQYAEIEYRLDCPRLACCTSRVSMARAIVDTGSRNDMANTDHGLS